MKSKIKRLTSFTMVFFLFVLAISFTRSIFKILGSNQKILDAQMSVDQLKNENIGLQQKLKDVESVSFMEQEARDKLGLAKKGEIVVVLPELSEVTAFAPKDVSIQPLSLIPNWKRWFNLFASP